MSLDTPLNFDLIKPLLNAVKQGKSVEEFYEVHKAVRGISLQNYFIPKKQKPVDKEKLFLMAQKSLEKFKENKLRTT